MSRGHGKIQRAVLMHLQASPRATTAELACRIYAGEPCHWQLVSVRRALATLVNGGSIKRRSRGRAKLSAHRGGNAAMIASAAALYIRDGDRVADVTYGLGSFWKQTDVRRFCLLASDLLPNAATVRRLDFRKLPYAVQSIDVLVLDPPYVHTQSSGHARPLLFEHRYRNRATTDHMSHADIMALYREGMREAYRVLKPGGYLWVKTKDEIESGRQRWSHIAVHDMAKRLGFVDRDLFILITAPPANRWRAQKHARKNHSYLWIFAR